MQMQNAGATTRAAKAGDDGVEMRVDLMLRDDEASFLAFARDLLAGGWHPAGAAPHGNRRIEREAVIACWRARGMSWQGAAECWHKRTSEWEAVPRRIVFQNRLKEGVAFSPGFLDDVLRGPLRPSAPLADHPPAGADPRTYRPPPMVRRDPLAPESVREDATLVMAWLEWLGSDDLPHAEVLEGYALTRSGRPSRRKREKRAAPGI